MDVFGGYKGTHGMQSNFRHFSNTFWQKFCEIIAFHSLLRGWRHFLGNPGCASGIHLCTNYKVRYSPTGAGFELDVVLLAGVVDELDAGVLLPVPHRLQDVRLHVICTSQQKYERSSADRQN